MFVANIATLLLAKAHLFAFWLFQDDTGIGWDPIHLWKQMSWVAQVVVVILFIMSAWSIGVMIDRWIAFSAARKQTRQFAPVVAGALREGKLDEAIRVAERNKKSHLAKVVTAGLQEFKAHGESTEIPGEQIEASKRALERAEVIAHPAAKPGGDGSWLNVSTLALVGFSRTVTEIRSDFKKTSEQKATGLAAVAGAF